MPILFAVTMFASAALLFVVQPMVGKMLLPLLGGTPAVWNACMVFYQAALLAGYAYAHACTRTVGVRKHAAVHLILVAVPLLVLPIVVDREAAETVSGVENPIPWLLTTLAVMVGLPFFVLSTTAPLLQKWFAETGHTSGKDPYFLYAASNAGSMLALLAYPALLEPLLPLTEQSSAWRWGYIVFAILVVICAMIMWSSGRAPATSPMKPAANANPQPINQIQPARWVLLSAIPSSLMLGVTMFLTTDIAAVPLLWVIPLALYLLSFILVFAGRSIVPHRLMVRALPAAALALLLILFIGARDPVWLVIPVHLGAFFITAMACHGELARLRPPVEHLTGYYLWMSVGGVLGGLFNSLIAPTLFQSIGVVEYPLAIIVACAVMPRRERGPKDITIPEATGAYALVFPAVLGLIAYGIVVLIERQAWAGTKFAGALFALALLPAYLLVERPARFALALAAVYAATLFYAGPFGDRLFYERNFFGVVRVTTETKHGWHQLIHGSTIHGRQMWKNGAGIPEPTAYYHRSGPIGDVFRIVNERTDQQIAVCGLGAGAVVCYAKSDQHWTLYELDPTVARVAQDERYFTFLSHSGLEQSRRPIDLGDARLQLARHALDDNFGLIIIDAFSSDAIPVHLIDREALALYLKKLAPDGIIAFHISNDFLDLQPVLANLANHAGLTARCRADFDIEEAQREAGKQPSVWVAMARKPDHLRALMSDMRWKALKQPRPGERLWTDDFSNLLSVFQWRKSDD